MVSGWKRKAVENIAASFGVQCDEDPLIAQKVGEKLHAESSQLVVEHDFCWKRPASFLVLEERLVKPDHSQPSVW